MPAFSVLAVVKRAYTGWLAENDCWAAMAIVLAAKWSGKWSMALRSLSSALKVALARNQSMGGSLGEYTS